MDFDLTPEHQELRNSVRSFVEQKVFPQIWKYEEKSIFPMDIFREMGQRGFLRAYIPVEHGGLGLGTMAFCIISEEMCKAGFGMSHYGHVQTVRMLIEFGTETQRSRYLSKLLTGELLGATAIAEPTAGSSLATMQTTVEKKGNTFVLNGAKTLINEAAEADVINVYTKGGEGISVFLVEKQTPGFRILKKLNPMGMRSSPIYDFELRNCEVNSEQLVGVLGGGFQTFFSAFNFTRLGNASACIGMAQAALDNTIKYLKQRFVGTRNATEFQGLRWRIADMSTELEAARLLRDRAAIMLDQKKDMGMETSRVKLFAVEVAKRVVRDCIQSVGGYGCLRENFFDLYLRDVAIIGTAGGTLEVMRNNIAKRLLGS
jgi:hypothetical protein